MPTASRDVVAGSFDTCAYAMDGTDGAVLWSYPTDNRVYSIYPVGDLNADGTPGVVVGTRTSRLPSRWSTSSTLRTCPPSPTSPRR
jgi:outer membrane protein assembly factor BamB